MEWKIGEIRQINGEWYQCVNGECKDCDFSKDTFYCKYLIERDFCKAKSIFKKLEKVGEPYIKNVENDLIYQLYKLPMNVETLICQCYWVSLIRSGIVEIAIKQTKEDMEAKNNNHYDGRMDEECIPLCDALNSLPGVETTSSCCGHCKNDFMIFFNCNDSYSLAIIARAFNRRYSGTYLEWKIEVETHDNGRYDFFMHSVKPYPNELEMKTDIGQLIENLEWWKAEKYKKYFNYESEEKRFVNEMLQEAKKENEQKPSIKPFDLEAARRGKPVCTRDGRKARIICFDRINGDYYKIVACVTAFDGDFEEVLSYGIDGYIVDSQNPKDEDLMMLPEKKIGWINIYKGNKLDADCIYPTLENALENILQPMLDNYIDTIKVEWEELV